MRTCDVLPTHRLALIRPRYAVVLAEPYAASQADRQNS